MKPLHSSELSTASDSRMVVRVGELSTPDGPVRRIVVEVNAEMDTTEARWLRDKLDLAITLAEEPAESPNPTMPCWCIADDPCRCPGRESIKDCPCYRHGVANHEPAVSEDQPKPREARVWRESDAEPEDRPKVRDKQHDVWTYDPISGLWYTPDTTPFEWQRVVKKWGPVSEVLADSEQVRHG